MPIPSPLRTALAVLLLLPALSVASQLEITGREEARPGDVCIVCGVPLESGDPVLIVKGRRVPVAAKMEQQFREDPERYFSALQPKSALFTEELFSRALPSAWFVFGLWMLSSILVAGITAFTAVNRGLPPRRWFAIGLLGNLVGLGYLLAAGGRGDSSRVPGGLRKVPRTQAPDRCASCGAAVHPDANRCAACGSERAPAAPSEASRTLS